MEPAKLTQATTLTITTHDFLASHPTLYHYTTFHGLAGIVKSNTLWATHFSHLNDSSEITLLRDPLTKAVAFRFRSYLESRQNKDAKIRNALRQSGGSIRVSNSAARDLVKGLYKVTFDPSDAFPFAEPFIASFCSHSADFAYEKENGLLSQWRGYGSDGGFCIVFDSAKLASLLAREFNSHYWIHLNMDPVIYATDGQTVENLFPSLLERCEYFLTKVIDGDDLTPVEDGFAPFVSGATLFKHQGFREEREVRIVAIPGSSEVRTRVQAEHPAFDPPPLKTISVRQGNLAPLRYVSLFDRMEATLPIERIIVGPSRHQAENYARARDALSATIPLTRSVTPFIG